MKKWAKSDLKLFFLILLIIFPVMVKVNVFALFDNENDCSKVFNKDVWDNESILPITDLEIAINNLETYCCSTNRKNEEYCKNLDKSEVYPDSPYLFDHIVDVWLRRLDAEINWSYDWMSFDEKWLARRTKVDEIANSKDGTPPIELKNIFDKNFKFNILFFWEIKENDLSNYKDMTLYDRYNNRCEISKYIYEKLAPSNKILALKKDGTAVKKCKIITDARIEAEILYVKTLMMQKSNQILNENIQTYTNDYFAKERLQNLRDSILKLWDYMFKMYKWIGGGWTDECS